MGKLECPYCGSDKIGQYRIPTGPIWCMTCDYRVEHKEVENPFVVFEPTAADIVEACCPEMWDASVRGFVIGDFHTQTLKFSSESNLFYDKIRFCPWCGKKNPTIE